MSENERLVIILLGPPGAGKGTQAQFISERYSLPHISTGEILRDAIRKDTALGREAASYMNKGELVPDSIIIDLIRERFKQPDCRHGILLDGFPRNETQAKILRKMPYINGAHRVFALLLSIDDNEVIRRLSNRRFCPNCKAIYSVSFNPPEKNARGQYVCGRCQTPLETREDDTVETIRHRLNVYHATAEPMISLYRHAGILYEVSADVSAPLVAERIQRIVQ